MLLIISILVLPITLSAVLMSIIGSMASRMIKIKRKSKGIVARIVIGVIGGMIGICTAFGMATKLELNWTSILVVGITIALIIGTLGGISWDLMILKDTDH